jgi:hypothetical protein
VPGDAKVWLGRAPVAVVPSPNVQLNVAPVEVLVALNAIAEPAVPLYGPFTFAAGFTPLIVADVVLVLTRFSASRTLSTTVKFPEVT